MKLPTGPNAGTWPPEAPPLDAQTEARVREVLETDLLGAAWTARAFIGWLRAARESPCRSVDLRPAAHVVFDRMGSGGTVTGARAKALPIPIPFEPWAIRTDMVERALRALGTS